MANLELLEELRAVARDGGDWPDAVSKVSDFALCYRVLLTDACS
jgi:hypothetical protein